jgi:hypothetical protein
MQDIPEDLDIDLRNSRGSFYRYQAPREQPTDLEKLDTNVEPKQKQAETSSQQQDGHAQGPSRPTASTAQPRRQATFALPPETPASAKRSIFNIAKIAVSGLVFKQDALQEFDAS